MQTIDAAMLWTPSGWRSDAGFDTDANGRIRARDRAEPTASGSWIVPGIPNLHSHAFQRAMAGLAERRTLDGPAGAAPRDAHDSFWTWRETMYRMAARFDPDSLHAVAAQLYAEMLEAGYTTVCEFHYLHHAADGHPYADPAAMSRALIRAARDTGIRLTLLPVLYMSGGFDGRALGERQRRFGHDVDDFLALIDTLRGDEGDALRIGCALHSLRAVPPEAMQAVIAALPRDMPLHIHIAEQVGEVQDCLALRGARPVEWLLANAEVDARWTLVHATHLDDAEVQGIARSGATVAICPTTEANLGDGLFPFREYLQVGGQFGIGSDSHVSQSPIEELRWLEYGQRLQHQRRNIACTPGERHVGDFLWRAALEGGARAAGRPVGALEAGRRADLLVLDADHPNLYGTAREDVLGTLVFSGNDNLVRDVLVGGNWMVRGGVHVAQDAIAHRFKQAIEQLRRIP
jgi:formimidoylglutamate deiminase